MKTTIKQWASSDGTYFMHRGRKYRLNSQNVLSFERFSLYMNSEIFINYYIWVDDNTIVYVAVHPEDFTKYKIIQRGNLTFL